MIIINSDLMNLRKVIDGQSLPTEKSVEPEDENDKRAMP